MANTAVKSFSPLDKKGNGSTKLTITSPQQRNSSFGKVLLPNVRWRREQQTGGLPEVRHGPGTGSSCCPQADGHLHLPNAPDNRAEWTWNLPDVWHGTGAEDGRARMEEDDSELRSMTHRFCAALALTIPVLLLAMLPMLGVSVDRWLGATLYPWLQLLLSTPVVVWGGWPFFERGWRSIVTWNLNMFTLIAIGTGAAFSYSLIAVLLPGIIPDTFRHHGTVRSISRHRR